MIIAGHGRVEAAKSLGLERVPCLRLRRLSAAQKRAYILADNKLALNAGWDKEILALECRELIALDPEFDITLTGFEIPEIESLAVESAAKPARTDKDDRLPGSRSDGGSSVSRSGDLWVLGRHRVLCGSPSDDGSLERLMGNERAQLLFSQPCLSVLNANRPGHRYATLRASCHASHTMRNRLSAGAISWGCAQNRCGNQEIPHASHMARACAMRAASAQSSGFSWVISVILC